MAGWFARLMQKGRTRARPVSTTRDARYDAIVQRLRERDAEDRAAREKRQRWYGQHLKSDAGASRVVPGASDRLRLHRLATKVPCHATPRAAALLETLAAQSPGGIVTVPQVQGARQPIMLGSASGAPPRQIGWLEHRVESDASRCNVRHQGLWVDTDGGSMLVLQFRYPATATRVAAKHDDADVPAAGTDAELELPGVAVDQRAVVEFSEVRPALDLRPSDRGSSPRLVWATRPPEAETLNAVQSRDYEAFYVRFKREVLAGIWSSLCGQLSSAHVAQWAQGAYRTVVREPDAALGRIHQRTIDDSGRAVDAGSDRIYDAFAATDILLLYLEADILADVADICFTLQSLSSTEAYFLKEEFFTIIRRFWAGAESLTSRYGSDVAAVVRMSQRAVPMPAQVPLLRQDWTTLRQSLIDRYGERGARASDLVGQSDHRPRGASAAWPFATFPAGEVNIGLRLIYRQQWAQVGAGRGDVLRTVGSAGASAGGAATRVATSIRPGVAARSLDALVARCVRDTVDAMRWPLDLEGSINTGLRSLAASTGMGLEPECRESSRDLCARLDESMRKAADAAHDEIAPITDAGDGQSSERGSETEPTGEDGITRVYSRLQHRYEVLTRPAEIQNVVLVAEKLPAPAEIDESWIRRHGWIVGRVLLDETFRDALDGIVQDRRERQLDAFPGDAERDATRESLCEHVRANILHYQRAVWQQEDPQQRSMRFRKSGKRVPLEWQFELATGAALTIEELRGRLGARDVDGQFAAYSAGRDVELDQVIDPAGPVAFYGNYAVYHMRPEFGGPEVFAMLHFFKSPYLRPDAATGAPSVDDPARIAIGADPVALARFRQERGRRITVDTDSVIVDELRPDEVAPEASRPEMSHLLEAAQAFELSLEGVGEIQLRAASRSRETDARCAIEGSAKELVIAPPREWVVLRDAGPATRTVLAGARDVAPHSPGQDITHGIVWEGAVTAGSALRAGRGGVLLAACGGGAILPLPRDASALLAAARASGTGDRDIVARDDAWLSPAPMAGDAVPRRVHLAKA
jgi:hypothetical protein